MKLTHGKSDDTDFDLTEVDYGQYLSECRFTLPDEPSLINTESIKAFGNEFVIEVMKPNFFAGYINHLTKVLEELDKTMLEGWGEDNDLPF